MPVLLQVNFVREKAADPSAETLEWLREFPGLQWKIWIRDDASKTSGGIYLFEDRAAAEHRVADVVPRLRAIGATDIETRIFDVDARLTRATRGPLRAGRRTPASRTD